MADVRELVKNLIALQEKDCRIDEVKQRASVIPEAIEEQRSLISDLKRQVEETKKAQAQLQLNKKSKEGELEAKENEIRKHSTELNSIKNNEAYRALLVEIESCKQDKSALESAILETMEKMESEAVRVKEAEKKFKEQEGQINVVIAKREGELKELQDLIAALEKEREEFAKQVPSNELSRYDSIRESRQGIAVVAIDGETCSGCNMVLRPALINEVCKGQDLVSCDSCQRILYRK